jgi:hypothetical protein
VTRVSEGDYPLPADGFVVRLHGVSPATVTVDGRAVAVDGGRLEAGAFARIEVG